MERLNKKQKEILSSLEKVYPSNRNRDELLEELGYIPNDILADIKLLEAKEFVSLTYRLGDTFPYTLTITPKGIEKLQENFKTRIKDEIHNNPLTVIAIIISVLSIIANIYTSVHTSQRTESLSIDLNEVKGKIAQYDSLVVKNSTMNELFIPCSNGTKPQMTMYSGKSDDVRNGIIFNGTFIECV